MENVFAATYRKPEQSERRSKSLMELLEAGKLVAVKSRLQKFSATRFHTLAASFSLIEHICVQARMTGE